MAQKKPETQPRRRMRGFEAAAQLVAHRVKAVGEGRGFAATRLLTHWPEVVGPELAAHTRPVRISHGKSMGATLTLLVPGAQAPLIGMQLEQIRARVNACYGFNAVSRIVLTQTAPVGFAEGADAQGAEGFAEGQAAFLAAPRRAAAPGPQDLAQAEAIASGFDNPALSAAMRRLALNILSRRDANDRKANP
ncbi:hypothetical protein ATH84_103817 [Paracoccus versutus]|uniref:DUF721 domain-containing protein n=1 Tax=Paracoccus versutus TaxID=34007 RepID=A0AAQ0HEV7_PARVE|nr:MULTISPECIES: DciA family protein [Paracoccus]KGJ02559.1 Zn-ribbon-containing, possibly RNA-binding protein [Paracoccus versutus]REG34894.1 hypothetical protein ATH84_103817 [Paracoccus versutus]SFY40941.1 hypothetical protein SAMN04244548_04254 [Paracoccus pantotrophus]